MRTRARLAVLLLVSGIVVAPGASPAHAYCRLKILSVDRPWSLPGDTVVVSVPYRGQCRDYYPPPGTPQPPLPKVPVETFTLYLSRGDEKVALVDYKQGADAVELSVWIPDDTPEGLWTLRSTSGVRATRRFRVGMPPTLPRTGAAESAPLAAVGAWLVVAGAYALRLPSRRPAAGPAREAAP